MVALGALGGVANADPTRLRQVLINLPSNAIKYNCRGGRVVVQARVAADAAVLTVRDTGRGLIARVKSAAHSRDGRFTFTITLADGASCQVRYNQRAT